MEIEGSSKGMDSDKMDTEGPVDEQSNEKIFEEEKYDWKETIQPHIRIAVIGENSCGKSCLILAVKNQIFPHPDEKFVSKRYHLDVETNGKKEECMVAEIDDWDKNIDRRKDLIAEMDVVLLCFNETSQMMTELEKKWMPELEAHNVPVILVWIVKKLERGSLCQELTELEGLSGFMECCPHAKMGVQEVFQAAVRKVQERRV